MTHMTGAALWSSSRRLRGQEYQRPRIWRATRRVKKVAEMGARLDPRYGLAAQGGPLLPHPRPRSAAASGRAPERTTGGRGALPAVKRLV